jgi:hypothetical protein
MAKGRQAGKLLCPRNRHTHHALREKALKISHNLASNRIDEKVNDVLRADPIPVCSPVNKFGARSVVDSALQ